MAEMSCNDFIKQIQEAAGQRCEWMSTDGERVFKSKGWPTDPSHPVHRPDSDYIIPTLPPKPLAKSLRG